jgi:hypothetical protein
MIPLAIAGEIERCGSAIFSLFKLTNGTPWGSCRQLGTHLLEEKKL